MSTDIHMYVTSTMLINAGHYQNTMEPHLDFITNLSQFSTIPRGLTCVHNRLNWRACAARFSLLQIISGTYKLCDTHKELGAYITFRYPYATNNKMESKKCATANSEMKVGIHRSSPCIITVWLSHGDSWLCYNKLIKLYFRMATNYLRVQKKKIDYKCN